MTSNSEFHEKSLGQIAYEAAAAETDCDQPWSQANQAKWEIAAAAVSEAIKTRFTNMACQIDEHSDLVQVPLEDIQDNLPDKSFIQGEQFKALVSSMIAALSAGRPLRPLCVTRCGEGLEISRPGYSRYQAYKAMPDNIRPTKVMVRIDAPSRMK